VIVPEYHPDDFERCMLLVQYTKEDVIDKLNLIGKVQLVPFRPRFMFNGSGIDGIDNHTTQGPYPMIHVLREDKVSVAMDKLDSVAGRVWWKSNIHLLGRMEGWYSREGVAWAIEGG
jgi:hypothetical protein